MVNFSIILEILVKFTPFYIKKSIIFFFLFAQKMIFLPPLPSQKNPLLLTCNPLDKIPKHE